MGVNTWTPEQWRAYNARTGDRHVTRRLPPMSRGQALAEDVEQARALAELEGRRIGRARARAKLDEWLAGERRWIGMTSSRYEIDGGPPRDA